MRPTMLHGALQAVAYNINRQQRDLRFFERGRVYEQGEKGSIETESMSLVVTGKRFRERWRSADRKVELADVKEELEALLERMGIMNIASWDPIEHALLTNAHALNLNGRKAGTLGEVSRSQLKTFDVSQPVFFAELAEEVVLKVCKKQPIGFSDLSKFPVVRRDLSLLVDTNVKFESLKKAAFHAERKLLIDIDLFDVYEGEKLPKSKKSYAVSFILRDPERTLTDVVVDKAMGRIRQALEKEAGAELRS